MDDLSGLLDDPARGFDAPDPVLRRLAVSMAAGRLDAALAERVMELLSGDPEPPVRAQAAEVLGQWPPAASVLAALDDDPRVLEAAVTALGALRHQAAVPRLVELVEGDGDPLVREAAAAALGEIGDAAAVASLVAVAGSGPPQLRRRAVVALSVFETPAAEAAILAALDDRNPMVREAAELIAGRPAD